MLSEVMQTWSCGMPVAGTCKLADEPVYVIFVPCMLPLVGS